jgi:hypothetical protein
VAANANGRPIKSPMAMAPAASSAVLGRACQMSQLTRKSDRSEKPRSPRAAEPIQRAYWSGSGRVSPISARSRAARPSEMPPFSAGASSGSPGTIRSSAKRTNHHEHTVAITHGHPWILTEPDPADLSDEGRIIRQFAAEI